MGSGRIDPLFKPFWVVYNIFTMGWILDRRVFILILARPLIVSIMKSSFEKLACCGVRGVLERFRSYLSGRNQYVSVNGVNFNILQITSVVQQGSILGLIIFRLFKNHSIFFFWSSLICSLTIVLAMSCKFDDHELISNTLNSELTEISGWLIKN